MKEVKIGKKIMEDFCIGASTILNTVRSKSKMQKFVGSGQSVLSGGIRISLKEPKLKQLDKMVYKWFSVRRA